MRLRTDDAGRIVAAGADLHQFDHELEDRLLPPQLVKNHFAGCLVVGDVLLHEDGTVVWLQAPDGTPHDDMQPGMGDQ